MPWRKIYYLRISIPCNSLTKIRSKRKIYFWIQLAKVGIPRQTKLTHALVHFATEMQQGLLVFHEESEESFFINLFNLLMFDQIFIDTVEKANLLSRIFAKNETLTDSSQPLVNVECTEHFLSNEGSEKSYWISQLEVAGILDHVVRKSTSTLAQPLWNLFQKLYTSRTCPLRWMIANAQLVPK